MSKYSDEIASLESTLLSLTKPPLVIPNTTVFTETANCMKHGNYERRTRKSDVVGRIESHSACPDCTRERITELQGLQAGLEKRASEDRIRRLLEDLNLPERFKSASLDNYEPVNDEAKRSLKVCQAYASKWPERLEQGGGLVMCGRPGTGKNHLALAIAQHVIKNYEASALFTSAMRIARAYKSTWSKTSELTEAEVIRVYTTPDLLIIDEIGVQFGSDSEKMILFEIINNRYESMRPTILISNLPKDELSKFIGERVIDRMNDGGGCTLTFTWDSYRSRAA